MDSKSVNKEIRGRVWPLLKAAGFTRFTARSAWRDSNGTIDVLNFQSFNSYLASCLGVTSFSFAVNLGSFLTYVPPRIPPKVKDGHLLPHESGCHIRGSLSPTLSQPEGNHNNVWSVDAEGRNLHSCIEDVVQQLPVALEWFARLQDKSEVLRISLEQEYDSGEVSGIGNRPSPSRWYLTGYVALALGREQLARESLQNAVQSNCFKSMFSSVEEAIARAA